MSSVYVPKKLSKKNEEIATWVVGGYRRNVSISALAATFNVDRKTIRSILAFKGIEIDNPVPSNLKRTNDD